jgi:tol-pal system protein YbgF
MATQRDVLDLESQSDELKREVADLKKTISSLQANQADLSVQMKQLHEDLSASTEATRDSQDQMKKLSSKLDDMGATVTQKVASIGSSLTAAQEKSLAEQKQAAEQAAKDAATRGNPTDLFNTADVRLGVKDYSLAAKGFEDYTTKYPKGALIDVATFKLGQSYYGLKQWEKAGRQFAVVLDKFPKSEMTASSRLYYALSLVRMKKNLDEARQYLESVTSDFPKSPEAKAAAAELKKLDKKG